jgi:hypothetical protein
LKERVILSRRFTHHATFAIEGMDAASQARVFKAWAGAGTRLNISESAIFLDGVGYAGST